MNSTASGESARKPFAVLVVDDDPVFRNLLTATLAQAGAQAVTAANGDECLQLVARHSFDLIFMDIVMPGKDGIETIIELRKGGNASWIIAISSQQKLGDQLLTDAACALGANDFMSKPLNPMVVLTKVKAVAERLRASRTGG
jgi:CheY-like chemotaxis protein